MQHCISRFLSKIGLCQCLHFPGHTFRIFPHFCCSTIHYKWHIFMGSLPLIFNRSHWSVAQTGISFLQVILKSECVLNEGCVLTSKNVFSKKQSNLYLSLTCLNLVISYRLLRFEVDQGLFDRLIWSNLIESESCIVTNIFTTRCITLRLKMGRVRDAHS